MSLKNPVTPPEIDPGTVRLVAQRFNHYATPDSLLHVSAIYNVINKRIGNYGLKSHLTERNKPQRKKPCLIFKDVFIWYWLRVTLITTGEC